MYKGFEDFVKRHDYLVCVDSDGCAMDTMGCKLIHCFGPRMVKEWNLERWNEIDLYSLYSVTQGINRFNGLILISN